MSQAYCFFKFKFHTVFGLKEKSESEIHYAVKKMAMDLLLSFFGLKSSYIDKYHPLFSLPANIHCFLFLMMMMVFGQGEVLKIFQKGQVDHNQSSSTLSSTSSL